MSCSRNKFPACLISRELGLHSPKIGAKGFQPSHLLPRKRDQVAMIRAKVFCGSYDQRSGDHFISAAQDCLIRVFDTSVGKFKLVKTIIAQEVGWSILDCVISPTSDHLLYTSWSPTIRLVNYKPETGNLHQCHQEQLKLETHSSNIAVFSVRYSPNGQEVVAGASDHCVYIYDLEKRKQVLRIRAQENDVNAVAFIDDSSNIMCSGGDEGLVKVWDRRQLVGEKRAKPVGIFTGHYDGITFIDSRGDNRHLISNSKDQTIKLWDMRCFASKSGIAESKALTLSGQWDYRWAPVPRRVTMNRDRMMGDTSIMTYRGHTVRQTLIRCHFSPAHSTGQRYIYTGCASGNVFVSTSSYLWFIKLLTSVFTCTDI
jgi:WD repeat-containing protein 23